MQMMSNKDIYEKKAVIFDVDGTLYNQSHMRIYMFIRLVSFYSLHLKSIKELIAIYYFRKLREEEKYRASGIEKITEIVAERLHIKTDIVASAIKKWMFEIPLDVINKCSYSDVISCARKFRDAEKKIIIYSDYPAEEKLSALEIPYDYIFVSGEGYLQELKPSIHAMKHILHSTELSPNEIIYIGDRDEKDGTSAKLVGIQYCDIHHFRRLISKHV